MGQKYECKNCNRRTNKPKCTYCGKPTKEREDKYSETTQETLEF